MTTVSFLKAHCYFDIRSIMDYIFIEHLLCLDSNLLSFLNKKKNTCLKCKMTFVREDNI